MRDLLSLMVIGGLACGTLVLGCKKQEATPAAPATAEAAPVKEASNIPPLNENNIVSIAINSKDHTTLVAAIKAADEGLEVNGSVMASDAFFPFRDGIDAAAETGIAAIIQPGGSMRDEEVIQAANEHGLAMVFTGMRHFRH